MKNTIFGLALLVTLLFAAFPAATTVDAQVWVTGRMYGLIIPSWSCAGRDFQVALSTTGGSTGWSNAVIRADGNYDYDTQDWYHFRDVGNPGAYTLVVVDVTATPDTTVYESAFYLPSTRWKLEHEVVINYTCQ